MKSGIFGRCVLAAAALTFMAGAGAATGSGGALQLLSMTPAGDDVPPGQEIVLQFDRPMVALGNMARSSQTIPVHITPALDCEWRWLNSDELACRLPGQQRLRPATRYSLRIETGFTALDGSRLAQPLVKTFTTQRPRVSWTSFQRWQSPVVPVYLVNLDLPVTAAELESHLRFVANPAPGFIRAIAKPFTKERSGPLLLPVPGKPGAMIFIENPEPTKPEDAGKPEYAARRTWLVEPREPLAPSMGYTLKLEPGLKTPLGPLSGPGGIPGNVNLHTYGAFRLQGIRCQSADGAELHIGSGNTASVKLCVPDTVQLEFSAPVPLETLRAVRWSPAPVTADKLRQLWGNYPQWSLQPNWQALAPARPYYLPFAFDPMQSYAVSVPAGEKDIFGRKLEVPTTVSFSTGHLPPALNLPSDTGVLEAGQDTAMPVGFANLTALGLQYRKLTAATLAAAPASSAPANVSLFARYAGKPPQDKWLSEPLGIRDLLGGRPGVVSGTLSWQPKTSQYDSGQRPVFGEVTPWEVLAKVGYFDTLVWVSSLSTGQPVPGASVRLYKAPKNDLSAIAPVSKAVTTDADGLAVLPGSASFGPDWINRWQQTSPDWYVGATEGEGLALMPLNYQYQRSIGQASGYAFSENNEPANGHVRVWGFTAQGVYRPGDTAQYALYVRGVSAESLVAAPALDYSFTITDPTGKTVLSEDQVKLSEFGGLHGNLYIPKNAATGWYDMQVSWSVGNQVQAHDAGRFLVTAFVPETFKVTTLLHGSLFTPGDTLDADAEARLHAGGPYTEAQTKFTVTVEAQAFAPTTPVAAGFSFDVNPDDVPASATFYQNQAVLDHAGNAHMQFKLPAESPIVYGNLVVQSAVESARGTWVAGRASAVWAARDRFVGLRLDDWLLTAGKPFKLHTLVVDVDGKPVAGSAVHVLLERQHLNVVQVADGTGNFAPQQNISWDEEAQCDLTSTTAPVDCTFTPAHAGVYRMVASVKDTHGVEQKTTLSAWSTGPGEVLWPMGEYVTLVPDKASYHVGDTAHVLVQNPYPGARALVTVERYGVLWKKLVTLKTATPVLDIPVQADFFPGAYISVSIFSPRVAKPGPADLGKPTLASGYAALPVVGKGSSLEVAVTPARTEYKPREQVEVNVAVRDAQGKPAAHTRVVAAVVDEAVLDLLQGGAGYYDPRKTFYAPPGGPDIQNYSLIGQLVTTLKAKALGKGISPGGGGGGGLQIRSIFKYTAYWKPDLETDAQGRVQFSFETPDNLTGWRVLAMALTPGAAMGLGQSTVRVNLPLQLAPALPNQVHVGDIFDAGFDVTNRTPDAQHVSVAIDARGAARGQSKAQLDLASYAHSLAWLNLAPKIPGVISLLATARAGKLGDALEQTIPVTVAGTREVAAEYGSTVGLPANVAIKLPANALPGSGRLTVSLAPTALANLEGAFAHMHDDPLRTWEMRLSRGVMASDYLALKDALPASVQWPGAAAQISDTLEHAADFQAPNGGMAFWIPRNEFVSPWLSVYTDMAFSWLHAAGHAVPSSVQTALDGYLKDQILNNGNNASGPAGPVLVAGAMAALAMHGVLPAGNRVAGMLPQLPQLDLFGKALLLQAALASHDDASAAQILTAILAHSEQTGGTLSFQETESDAYVSLLASPLRSNCAILDALVAATQTRGVQSQAIEGLPAKLLRWIDARRKTDGAWPNSQENVFCTTAQVHYARAFETPVQNLAGSASVAGKAIGAAEFAARNVAPASVSAAAPAQAASVTVNHGGVGRLYYGVQLAYDLPPAALPPVDAGFSVRRDYEVQRGADWVKVTDATQLKRGDIVRVDLYVDAPAERHYVVLSDPLPGAFEAVNHQLANADQATPQQTPDSTTLWFDYGDWPNFSIVTGGFYHRDTGFDAVRFYADVLPAGHYHVIYAVQVIAPGRFLAPPPQIHEIYQPDVFGRGRAATVNVQLPNAGAAARP